MLVCLVVIVCTCKKYIVCRHRFLSVMSSCLSRIKKKCLHWNALQTCEDSSKAKTYIWPIFSKTNLECKWPFDMTSGIRWGGRVIYLDISNWDISIKDPGWFRTGSPTPWAWVLESVSSPSGEGRNPVRYDRRGLHRQRCPGKICSNSFTGNNLLAGCVAWNCCCWLS